MSTDDKRRTPRGEWVVARVFGIELRIKPSLLLMAAILIFVFAPRFGRYEGANPYLLAALFVLALYICVLIHELAHVAVARKYRMHVPSVTLHLLGGETAIEGDSRTPAQELWTAVVGPLASIGLALIAWIVADRMSPGNLQDVLAVVAYVNLVVGVVNLIPGLPLDGGRVCRAVIWALTGNRSSGTVASAWAGRMVAIAVLVAPFIIDRGDNSDRLAFDVVLAVLIAFFLWTGATAALSMASRESRLDRLGARDLAVSEQDLVAGEHGLPGNSPSLNASLRGADLLRAMAAHPSEQYRLVENDGTPAGILQASSVDAAYRKGQA